jgi:hypothetical protein
MDLPIDKRQLHELEVAALDVIADEHAETEPQLAALFQTCTVTNSENTGGGFFTALASDKAAFAPVALQSPTGDAWFDIDGMQHGICCLVFFIDGYPTLLEGYAVGGEDTSKIEFGSVKFKLRSRNRLLE